MIDVVDDSTYDGSIPLDQKAEGNPGAALQTSGNPFADAYFYLSPDIKTMMDYSLGIIEASGNTAMANKIKYVQRQPSAVWMDSIAAISGDPAAGRRSLEQHLDAALAQQQFYASQNGGQIAPMTAVIIIYNLPDRDCAAYASNGKLIQVGKPGTDYSNWETVVGQGYNIYKNDYIEPIAQIFANPKYKDLRIVAMLEPDSFPNMITNTNEPGTPYQTSALNPKSASLANGGYCDRILRETTFSGGVTGEGSGDKPNLGIYAAGLRLAINRFHSIDNVYTYLDIGHAGWLGWDSDAQDNMRRGVKYFTQLVDGADGHLDGQGLDMIRGFASNTSGYTPLDEPLISNRFEDRMNLQSFYQWNESVDELTYIDKLKNYFVTAGFDQNKLGFIIDTARNGWGNPQGTRPATGSGVKGSDPSKRVDKRPHRGHWCNVNKAGVGEVPRANPVASRPHLDAFFWMKPPGESDGISFNHTQLTTDQINQLDAVDQKIYQDASNPVYAGKSLDTMCIPGQQREAVTVDVVPAMAPHAGAWFHKQFLMLIDNAYPALGESDYD